MTESANVAKVGGGSLDWLFGSGLLFPIPNIRGGSVSYFVRFYYLPWSSHPSQHPCAVQGAGLCATLLPHKRLIYFICDPIILGTSRKMRSHTEGYNDRWRLTGRDICNYICCSHVPPNQCQTALEMSSGGSRAGWGNFLTVSIRKQLF